MGNTEDEEEMFSLAPESSHDSFLVAPEWLVTATNFAESSVWFFPLKFCSAYLHADDDVVN